MTTYRVGGGMFAAGLMLAALTGCGGGGGSDSPPTSPSPPTVPPAPPATVPPPGPGVTSGDTYGVSSTGRLVTFDRADPALDTAIAITGLQASETVVGLDVRAGGATPGELYGLGSTGRLYTINTTTGVATLKSTLTADAADTSEPFTALAGTEFGVDFNPVTDRLRIVSDTGQNLRVDADTGATFTDAALASGGATRAGVNAAAYTNAFSSACRTDLYYIDATTDQLLTTTDPNAGAVTVVGSLGVDATSAGDLEIATAADGTNNGYAVLVVGGTPTSYQINLTTGVAASAGAVSRLDSSELLRDTAIAPPATPPTQTAGDVFALTESNKLVSFNASFPQKSCTSVALSGQQSGENIVSIDVRPSDTAMYALGSTGRVYTVDTATGALTTKSTLAPTLGDVTSPFTALTGTSFGMEFNPGTDVLRVATDSGLNMRVNVDTGATTTDTATNPAGPLVAESAHSNSFVGAGTTLYYTIDSAGDALQVLGRPSGSAINGDLQTVGALGVGDISGVAGFDIFGTNNWGLAALNVGGAATSDLFNVNLQTGAATRVNTIGGGERVRGLAYGRLPVATVFALTTDNHLVSFKPLTPGTFDSDVAISGLQGTEVIVGIDFRPTDGALYAVTDAGRLYTVDPATGAASGAVTLAANPLDASAPFTALAGTQFSVDFSPLDNLLRILSDSGQNLRVDVNAGTVITDANLAGTPQVVETAFSNSYAGASGTFQYDLDVATGALLRQGSNGALTTVGSFNAGTTFTGRGGFDIAGGENGLSVAALQPTSAAQSTFYRVNLGNGALTSLGLLGSSGTTVVKSLAVRLN